MNTPSHFPPARPARAPADWAATRARLDHVTATLSGSRSEWEVKEVLRKRADALAIPVVTQKEGSGEQLDVVAFTIATQSFAIGGNFVREALLVGNLTPLPGMPAALRGLANVRSRIVPAFDLKPLLQLAPHDESSGRQTLLIVTHDGADFGLLVDAVLGPRTIAASRLRTDVPGLQSLYLRGLTEDGLILLDLAAIAGALTIDGRTA